MEPNECCNTSGSTDNYTEKTTIIKRNALIIVDVQNDFCEGGSLEVKNASEIIPVINKLKTNPFFHKVFLTADWHPSNHASFQANNPGTQLFSKIVLEDTRVEQVMWPTHCVQDTFGSQFHQDLNVSDSDIIVKKATLERVDSYSGFGTYPEDTGLNKLLKDNEITTVYCVGLAFDYCVGSTARDAAINEFETYIIMNGTKHISEKKKTKMSKVLSKFGVQLIDSFDVADVQKKY